MRYLGIDHGDKRIGIAMSDEGGTIAFPVLTIKNKSNTSVLHVLKELIRKNHIEYMIVGLPISFDGKETNQMKKIRSFSAYLGKHIKTPIAFENEMLTTRIVEQEGIAKEYVDKSSAALILQSYIDRINRH